MVGYLRHMYLLLLRSPFWILHFIIKSCLYFLTFLLAALNSTFWDVKILFTLPFACNWHICMLFIFVFLFLIFRNCLLHNLLYLVVQNEHEHTFSFNRQVYPYFVCTYDRSIWPPSLFPIVHPVFIAFMSFHLLSHPGFLYIILSMFLT